MAIGRVELKAMYEKAELQFLGARVASGAVTYELAVASMDDLQQRVQQKIQLCEALKKRIDWQLPFAYFAPSPCYHGGQFFKAVGE